MKKILLNTKPQADWLAWILHYLFGLVVGALAGWWVASPGRRGRYWHWIAFEHYPLFLSGCALIGACLGSLFGERLWTGLNYRVIPPDGIEHSHLSRGLSIASGVAGAVLVLLAVLRNAGVW